MKNDTLKIIGVVMVVFGLIIAIVAGSWAWRYYTAEIRGVVDAEQQIEGRDSRIANYEYFYDLCSAIKSYQLALQVQKSGYEQAMEQERSEDVLNRYQSNIIGLESQFYRAIQRYNADARKVKTRARFLGEDLPLQIHNEGPISCSR